MGFYLRTSLKAGPFRFSLSPSGVGISAGVPGFRVGTGPRGNYIRVAGVGATYYGGRKPAPAAPPAGHTDGVVMRELVSTPVQELVAAHASDLITQMQAAARRRPWWPWMAVGVVVLALIAAPYSLALLVPGVPAVLWMRQRDIARRSVVVFYQVEDAPAKKYADLPYAAVGAQIQPQRFIESEPPPTDAQRVGTTWQYANKSGGPDRRFKNNRQLPIMLYGRLTLTGPQGLLMVWDFSRPDVAESLAGALNRMR
jgi:hypothetical protein